MKLYRNIREYENLHIVLWLLKDMCWVMLWRPAGLFMILPTIGVALHITWLRRNVRSDLFHNLAVCFWIMANSVWMVGEFYMDDGTRHWATFFFIAGLMSVASYYLLLLFGNKTAKVTQQH